MKEERCFRCKQVVPEGNDNSYCGLPLCEDCIRFLEEKEKTAVNKILETNNDNN